MNVQEEIDLTLAIQLQEKFEEELRIEREKQRQNKESNITFSSKYF